MFVFALLLTVLAVLQVRFLSRRLKLNHQADRAAFAYGVMFAFTGLLHFVRPEPFIAMVPPSIPAPELVIALSGIAELLVAAGLLVARTRRVAAMAAVVLLAAVLPANIYAATSGVAIPDYPSAAWYRWLRVFLQIPLALWIGLAARGLSVRPAVPARVAPDAVAN